ncbi:hypothetical protein N617_gp36 [Stygiolobus rod-shaped virus]|uniref:Uncharacterized protein n=1 Tax=Stygiolobus rod-shaped virus TaxID=537009 RepID=B6EFE2_9VIRU|nr:hypothetical protein N617_gp36 [Stygiolobus rod-shaped virus]CAQ58477.1 hypothetical protein [Stygiolobus rod-shaped virus]
MVRVILVNSFSINMITDDKVNIRFVKINFDKAREIIELAKKKNIKVESYIGHESTAQLLTRLLNYNIVTNRTEYKLQPTDVLLIFSLSKRLSKPEDIANINESEFNVFIAVVVDLWIAPGTVILSTDSEITNIFPELIDLVSEWMMAG